MRPLLLAALLVCLSATSKACLNDRDSDALATQNARFPDALRVLSGRFERNPPRFYILRIARVTRQLLIRPRDFALYADLAVAFDKSGDDESALRAMAHKRALLPPFDAKANVNKEAWYRYYANDGTFRVHRFLKQGAKPSALPDLRFARGEIARALQIKPTAHWGREKYRLAVMDWMIGARTKKTEFSLGDFLLSRFQIGYDYDQPHRPLPQNRREMAQGIASLIVLGEAWSNPDLFDALATALETRPTIALSYLARQRSQELLRNGAHSLLPKAIFELAEYQFEDGREFGLNANNAKTLEAFYPKLRAEADDWKNQRDNFMASRFATGKHPDTDTDFWKGWHEPPAPQLAQIAWWNDKRARRIESRQSQTDIFLSFYFLLSLLVALPTWWVWQERRKIRKRKTSAL